MTLYLVRWFAGERPGHQHRVIPIYDQGQQESITRRHEPLVYEQRRRAYAIARRLNQTEELSMEGGDEQ